MKLLKLIVLTIIFTCFSLSNETLTNPFLWKVEKDKKVFYLFGTMHLADPKLQNLPESLKNVIKNVDIVRTEIDLNLKNQLEASKMMMRADQKSLKDILPKDIYNRANNYLGTINPNLTLKSFDHMKVWAVATVITLLKNQLKYPFLKPIDGIIFNYAKNEKKDIGGIETIHEQLSSMDSFSLREQILELESSLDYLEKNGDYLSDMKKLYIQGDKKALMDFINKNMYQMPKYKDLEQKFMQKLVFDRNKRMAERIEKLVNDNPNKKALFAFGVMHFISKKSILDILKGHGYSIERIK
ncbi:MAG: TraB/GumN family protein [Epsilonproteobacteria bacterium]|nr:TraB/GumN family protein [Campylobacterota bacterium]